YEATNAWPYYGIGSRSHEPLSFPGAPGVTFRRASHYEGAKHTLQPNGTTYSLYNTFIQRRPPLQLGLERLFLGGTVRHLLGIGLSYDYIRDYTGRSAEFTGAGGSTVHAIEAPTLLREDCDAKRILGCAGGFDNVLRVAISYDTRDFEPDPNSGVYMELSTETATRALGSSYEYLRAMLSVRGFYSPIPRFADLVIAVRGLYEVQSSGTPFFSMQ